MNKSLLIAAGAGLATATLFSAAVHGAGASIVVAYLSPLPIMIAALGFGQATGLIAAALASTGLGAVFGTLPGVIFALLIGFPSWWLCYLALLARPLVVTGLPTPTPALAPVLLWYPVGRLVFWAAAIVSGTITALGIAFVLRMGGFDAAVDAIAGRLNGLIGIGATEGIAPASTARQAVQVLPVLMAASSFVMLLVNLWLSARIVQRSGLLARPWPSLPEALRLPKVAAAIMAIAIVLAFLGGGVRVAGGVVGASLGVAFVLQGLAAAHALTRGLAARRLILFVIYFITLTVVPSLVALAVLGIVDCLFSLRQRRNASPLPNPKN